MLRRTNVRNTSLILRKNPSNQFFRHDAVFSIFPDASKSHLLPSGAIIMDYPSLICKTDALLKSPRAFGKAAFVDEPQKFIFIMAVRRFPPKTEPNRLTRYLWESAKGFCYSSLRNKRDKGKCTLLVGTSSFESFSEILL